MATREERLLGHQLVKRTNACNRLIQDSGFFLRDLDPLTWEPLVCQPTVESPEGLVGTGDHIRATVEDIKTRVEGCCVVAKRQSNIVQQFISRYPDTDQIIAGLAHFQTAKTSIDTDVSAVSTHSNNVQTALSLVTTKQGLQQNGDLLSLYKPLVDREVLPNELSFEELRISSVQDLLNYIALTLRGTHPGRGTSLMLSAKELQAEVVARIDTIERMLPTTPNTQEVSNWIVVKDYIKQELQAPHDLNDLKVLADYIDTHVARLPLPRRWWNY